MNQQQACGGATEVYSRVTGFYRPVQSWNEGKTREFQDRQTYNVLSAVTTDVQSAGSAAAHR